MKETAETTTVWRRYEKATEGRHIYLFREKALDKPSIRFTLRLLTLSVWTFSLPY